MTVLPLAEVDTMEKPAGQGIQEPSLVEFAGSKLMTELHSGVAGSH